jgi:hypothetical protein
MQLTPTLKYNFKLYACLPAGGVLLMILSIDSPGS